MNFLPQSASRRNTTTPAFEPRNVSLTPGGELIYRRTCRPISTCNAVAALAGIGQKEA
jgi:hypothetical protein